MKRWLIRLSVLSAAGVMGFIAIARAQRTTEDVGAESTATDVADNDSTAAATSAATVDPFVRPASISSTDATGGNEATLRPSANFGEANPLRGRVTPASAEIDRQPPTSVPASARRDPMGLASSVAAAVPATAGQGGSRYPSPPTASADRYAAAAPTPAAPPAYRYPDTAPAATPPSSAASYPATSNPATPNAATPSPLTVASNDTSRYRDAYGTPPADSGALRAPVANPAPAALPPQAPAPTRFEAPIDRATPPSNGSSSDRSFPANRPATTSRGGASASLTATSPAAGATGRPGGRQLEGPQAPNLVLHKTAPEEIQVGKPATFDIAVRNTGNVTAKDVKIHDSIPAGTRLLGTKPKALTDNSGRIIWSLGNLEPGDEKFVEIQLMPETEGEVGSVASVTFRTDASVRTLATRPELKLDVSSPGQVMIGDDITLKITVSNLGTGAANDIVLFESLPSQLRHPSGAELEFDVGDLAPKETREIQLSLTAVRPGVIDNLISARGDGSVTAEASARFEVIAPALAVTISGPSRRYLERQATYTVQVANPGTAPAKDIELVSRLPRALKFISANNAGHYDQKTHAVYWSLEELPKGEQGNVKLVALPIESGEHTLRVESTAKQELSDSTETTVRVEGVSALFFEVVDVEDPVEVGGDTVYEIRVLNQGTRTANGIVVAVLVPQGMRALSADGPTQNQIQGNRVIFQPLPRLAPKADTTYTLRVQGVEPGDQRLRVQIQSDEMDSPVTKEESTRVYTDR